MMRAVVFARKDVEGIKMVSVKRPSFNATKDKGRLSCRVVCAGINPVDAKALIGDKLPEWASGMGRRAVEGRTAGFDFSGTVLEVPVGCDKFKVGDAIFGTMPPGEGSFSEYVVAPLDQVAPKPKTLSFAEAAVLPLSGLTSLQSLVHDNDLKAGQHLLIIGASGGVGHIALQVAKASGARVTAICSSRNDAFVRGLGADDVVDYTKGDAAVREQLQGICATHGAFDLCLDTVSSLEAKDKTTDYPGIVRGGEVKLLTGRYITIGGHTGDWMLAGLKRTVGVDLFPKGRMLFWVRFPKSAGALERLTEMSEGGGLRPVVALEATFEEEPVRGAFAALHGRRVVGKQCLRVAPDP